MAKKSPKSSLLNGVERLRESFSTPQGRSGATVERVYRLRKAGVGPGTIASQLTENSPTQQEYTIHDVRTMEKLAKDCKTRVPITQKQTDALIKDQENVDLQNNSGSVPIPT